MPTAFELLWKGMLVVFLVIGILYGFIKLMNFIDVRQQQKREKLLIDQKNKENMDDNK